MAPCRDLGDSSVLARDKYICIGEQASMRIAHVAAYGDVDSAAIPLFSFLIPLDRYMLKPFGLEIPMRSHRAYG